MGLRLKVSKDERILVYKDGDYVRTLKPGKYWKRLFADMDYQRFNVDERFWPSKNLNLYLEDKELSEELDIVEVADHEIALHYTDGHFAGVLRPGKYAFWKVLKKHEFIAVDFSKPEIPESIQRAVLLQAEVIKFRQVADVATYEKGLLFFNGEFQRTLEPGKYYFWDGPTKTTVQMVDMRQLQIEISGQEIMTRDKVSLRLNFVVQYKITDPQKAMIKVQDYKNQLYVLVQLALREYVGTFTLEELLEKKEEIGKFVLESLLEQSSRLGIEFIFAGVKDVILPGEMRSILSQVIEAEKKAQANLITRREETASTRSLLNTAKLMENNPVLLRLKELEYIESIANRIESLSLSGSVPLIEQLGQIFSATQSSAQSRGQKE